MNDDVWMAEPTGYPPGSPGKLAILQARATARLPLFSPGDYTFADVQPATEGGQDDGDD